MDPVSAVSVRSQNDRVALVALAGIATLWLIVSVLLEPLPPSQAFHDPVRAGRPVLLVIGPAVPVQTVPPDSKPGLPSRLVPVGGGVVPPQVSVPAGTAIAEKAFSVARHWAEPS